MHHFTLRNGVLHAEGIDLSVLAETVGTPLYCYSTATIVRHYQVFKAAFEGLATLVCYAVKANSNQAVLKTLARLGAGMDVVSEGELRRARAAGVAADKITFSGIGKTEAEMAYALDEKILCFNVESEPELLTLAKLAAARGRRAKIAVRVNPDIDAKTHAKIATGTGETKFGVPLSEARAVYRRAATLPGIAVTGLDMHIGSQITELAPFDEAFARAAAFVGELEADGHKIAHIDLGGGLGIPYRDEDPAEAFHPDRYAKIVRRHFGPLGRELIFEPGRLIVGNAGILLTRVLYVKKALQKTFVIVDAAMNDLVRPTLYGAHHEILAVRPHAAANVVADIVGPVCETGDFLALDRSLPLPRAGDLLAIMSAGAYGAVQAGTYNSRLLVPEVLVNGDEFVVVRPRGTYDQLIGLDKTPPWLG
ncbi:MAG: diaminopimelate decarboxylase [Methylovirgula sp.]|jgi:diaminopimelate decarboxylase